MGACVLYVSPMGVVQRDCGNGGLGGYVLKVWLVGCMCKFSADVDLFSDAAACSNPWVRLWVVLCHIVGSIQWPRNVSS